MNQRIQDDERNGMKCAEFDALLTDAMDGRLERGPMARFQAHAGSCPDCRPLLELATEGMQWMRGLPEVEPPPHLARNILAATTGLEAVEAARQEAGLGWAGRLKNWLKPAFAPVLGPFAQPRFAMSFGMAFFSVTVLLNAAGVRVTDLRDVDLKPSSVQSGLRRQYNETTARVVKYYENMRFVYELESRIRDLKNAALADDENKQDEKKPEKPADDKQTKPEQNQNYSQEQSQIVIAMARPPAAFGAADSRDLRSKS